MKIFVALWSKNTEAESPETPDQRFQALKGAVEEADKGLKAAMAKDVGAFTRSINAIFAAPEYLFTKQAGAERVAEGRAISSDEAIKLRSECKRLSGSKPGLLLIPGSFIYKHSVDQQVHTHPDGRRVVGREAVVASLRTTAESVAKSKEDVKRLAKSNMPELSIAAKLKQFDDPNYKPAHILKNCLYVFLNGETKAKYDKKGDMIEATGNVPGMFIPGKNSGLTTIGGIKFGFEICFDHDMGVLKALSGMTNAVDIHVVCSASIQNNIGAMHCRKAGFFLHASADKQNTDVYYKRAGLPVGVGAAPAVGMQGGDLAGAVEFISDSVVEGASLKCYVINLLLANGAEMPPG